MSSLTKKPSVQEKIKDPDRTIVEINGESFKIKPFSDVVFGYLSEAISGVVNTIGAVQIILESAQQTGSLDYALLVTQLPHIVSTIGPATLRIVGCSLKPVSGEFIVDKAWVEENIYFDQAFKILIQVLEANGVSDLLGEVTSAIQNLNLSAPTQETNSPDSTLTV